MFESEQHLVQCFVKSYPLFLKTYDSLFSTRRSFALTEFDSQYGVADIVVVFFRKYVKIGIADGVNCNWVQCLQKFNLREPFTFDDAMHMFGVSYSTVKKMIGDFISCGYVDKHTDGQYELIRPYEPVIEKAIAIEAKLTNWRQALKQAYRYRRFSHESFVLLPMQGAKKALEHQSMFVRYNIGLIGLEFNKAHFLLEPKKYSIQSQKAFLRLDAQVVAQYRVSSN